MKPETSTPRTCSRCGKIFIGENPECPDCASSPEGLQGLWHSLIYLVALIALLGCTILFRRW